VRSIFNKSAVKKIFRAFNSYGIDGLMRREDRTGYLLSPVSRKRRSSRSSSNRDVARGRSGLPRLSGEPKPRRSWAMKGSKPRVVHNGDHVRLNILGTVCPRTGEFFATEASHCDTDVFQAFLDEAAKSITPTRKRNILIIDNAS
jgi:hypothetical protein